jgi:hypothetical protein
MARPGARPFIRGWTGCQLVCVVAVGLSLLGSWSANGFERTSVDCVALPDAAETLLQAWQVYQPDQPMPFSIPVRRRLFAFQVLLISAGMYDEPPSDPLIVHAHYAPQFVRDFGSSRNPEMAAALNKLSDTLVEVRPGSEEDLDDNCGLILARRMLRADPLSVSTDWVLQTVTWGFAPMFQTSIRQLVHDHAQACVGEPDADGTPESVLACTIRRVGL